MVKHTQTIRRQIGDELFECVWPFYGIGALRVKNRPYENMFQMAKNLEHAKKLKVFKSWFLKDIRY